MLNKILSEVIDEDEDIDFEADEDEDFFDDSDEDIELF